MQRTAAQLIHLSNILQRYWEAGLQMWKTKILQQILICIYVYTYLKWIET